MTTDHPMTNNQSREFVLVVDDNPTNLSLLRQVLKEAGFQVRLAEDGKSAIEQVERALPILILLDVQMPVMDGFETCTRLKDNPKTRDIPVIFMTALSDISNKLKGLSLGAVDYITKPFEQQEVLARVMVHWRMHKLTQKLQHLTETLEEQVAERTASLQQAQIRLVQQEKLSTLGELVAGVAHEMNNPISCLVNNIPEAKEHISTLLQALALYQSEVKQPSALLQQSLEDLDLEFVAEDLPNLLGSMHLSTDRIKEISLALRTFSRIDNTSKIPFDLHQGLDSTLLILQHRLKALGKRPAIQVIKQYGVLPLVECYPGQINQVFMNLFANAIDALEEANQQLGIEENRENPNCITITTSLKDQQMVEIHIADSGIGMSEDIRSRIFDHSFTTKGIGKGTGLGLAIAHQIVVEKHQGHIDVYSQLGRGTTFVLTLPIHGQFG
ncbi:response regulator receiver sensor signal transduction histidine kinase [Tolypothrix tenuis PCC 7101]|uniref:histidine kinase n=2 Tax=Tolypothrix TaxID=111782 RepID=A0A1Z4MV06_9CYAN|nr:response regulator receiver sensor signal transduction histidine kinase [Tolypothrix tenuis PCC 7101]BAZ72179.1 response regulator receiver sensor signal transduction histidine kinase [Aulosira laxa NIES-50]